MRVGVRDARVVLFLVWVGSEPCRGLRIAQKFSMYFSRSIVGGQAEEFLAFLVGDDVDDVLVQPPLVLLGELGLLGGGGEVQGAEEAITAKAVRCMLLFSIFLQKEKGRSGRPPR